jgi:3',5'-cyclic-AMP phosphodiesterase
MATVRIIQITDFHIFVDPQQVYRGGLPSKNLEKVLHAIKADQADSQLILATGDLVSDDKKAYKILAKKFRAMGVPVCVLPGNHDNQDHIKKNLAGGPINFTDCYQIGSWTIIMLNSAIHGDVEGRLSETELNKLEKNLQKNQDKNILVALHHQPVPVGSEWIDSISLKNPDIFFKIIDKFSTVKGIVFGHVHQEFHKMRGDVHLMATPATSIQFAPGIPDMMISNAPPGYRVLLLGDDGSIDSKVFRV